MNFLVIDGNSIINRAFYGIKALNARDGHFTNAIHGFMTTFFNLLDLTKAEGVAVAFDVKQPTFRHELYGEYKAGRKPMPPELLEQMQPVKDILKAYGCHVTECPGYEADDILGTLSAACKETDHCYIATGDRDSLQLINKNTSVLLTVTKMGKTVTTKYTPEKLLEEYGVTPDGMIEIKALQGDSSDNIPGVPGIGPKTAGELIKKYSSIENIYENIESVDVTPSVRAKLISGRDSAFFSKKLGTICKNAPIDTDISSYRLLPRDDAALLEMLSYHELFKLISRLGLSADNPKKLEKTAAENFTAEIFIDDGTVFDEIKNSGKKSLGCVFSDGILKAITVCASKKCDVISGSREELCQKILSLAENGETVVFDSKKIYSVLLTCGNVIPEKLFTDIKLAAYLLDPNASSYEADALALSYGITAPTFALCDGIDNDAVKKTLLLLPLAERLLSVLDSNAQASLFRDIELPLSAVLTETEFAGMGVDPGGIRAYSEVLASNAEMLKDKIYEKVGEEFNINSPKQLGVILFEKLGLPCKKKTKTGYSTNADVLEELAEQNTTVADILQYRTFTKLKSTYCDGLLKCIASDGRIHCSFNQTETRTGRLSSAEPNLQNIPVRTSVGREFRKFFVARDGFSIVDADYSQIELRVLAAMSDDKNMIDAFNSGADIHTITASKVFNVRLEDVTAELRSKAKAVNFGIVYGIGAFSLSKDIHSTRAEAESFINSYLALYSSVGRFMKECIEKAKKDGYSETLFARRRYLPELSSSNGMLRAFGERVARNMPIQGTAADIIKIAMIKVNRRLKNELPEAKLIMQVHDELIIEAPTDKAMQAAEILKQEMEHAVSLTVTLRADVGIGRTWYDAKG